MAYIADEIMRAVGELGLLVEKLDDAEARQFRTAIENAYAAGVSRWPLWEAIRFPTAIKDEQAWTWIGEFVGRRSCILFFNPTDESSMFGFSHGADLDLLLRETFGFEFYVADAELSFLLCFNHHDMLLGAGHASPWLERNPGTRGR